MLTSDVHPMPMLTSMRGLQPGHGEQCPCSRPMSPHRCAAMPMLTWRGEGQCPCSCLMRPRLCAAMPMLTLRCKEQCPCSGPMGTYRFAAMPLLTSGETPLGRGNALAHVRRATAGPR